MSAPPPSSEYLALDFDATTLKIPQLRGILLEHGVPFSSVAKKAELVQAFEAGVRPKATSILSAASRVRPSNKGITHVPSEAGDTASVASSTAGTKRSRRPARATAEPEPEPEVERLEDVIDAAADPPPAKKPRGRPRKETSKSVEPKSPPPPKRGRGRPRKEVKVEEGVDEGTQAEVEDDATPIPVPAVRGARGRASVNSASPSVGSAPPSARKSRGAASTSSLASEAVVPLGPSVPQPVVEVPKSASKRKSDASLRKMDKLKEESEKEDEPVVSVKKEKQPKTPRRSGGEDSAFSDYNPFQSGSEDAAEREKRRRKSSIGVSARKPAHPRFSEPAPAAHTPTSILRRVGPSRESLRTPPKDIKEQLRAEREKDTDLNAAEAYNRAVTDKINSLGAPEPEPSVRVSTVATLPSTSLAERATASLPHVTSPKSVVPLSALFLLLLSFLANYKTQSASIGYCDPASASNDVLLVRQAKLDHAKACIERKTLMDLDQPGSGSAVTCDVSSLPLVPFLPRPTACTPCPPHGICEDGALVRCETEYILSPHPLALLGPVMDGVPGLGPKAFPARCKPDTAKKRLVGGLAREMEGDLAKGRGLVVCAGLGEADKLGRKGEGERFGMREETLKERYLSRKDPKVPMETFEEVFEMALKDLVEHGDVIESIDVDGVSWYAASRTEMTLGCRARMEMMDLLSKWKSQLGSTAAVLLGIAYLRSTVKHRREEKYRAEELVEVVLKRLQDQEHLHYVDPATTPNPFLPPDQLRDVVLPPSSASSGSRTRLWQRVTDLVEANANVAVREKEVHGEVWRVWEWRGVGERHVTWTE